MSVALWCLAKMARSLELVCEGGQAFKTHRHMQASEEFLAIGWHCPIP